MDWAAWAPAIISLAVGILIVGGYLATVRDHGRRLNDNDIWHKEKDVKDAAQDNAIARLEAWRDGYNAARVVYGRAFERVKEDERD